MENDRGLVVGRRKKSCRKKNKEKIKVKKESEEKKINTKKKKKTEWNEDRKESN